MTIGENIKSARKRAGLTQKELAERLGTATGTIQQYELDKRQPRLEQIQRIASALGVTVNDLIDDWSTVDKEEFKQVFIYGKPTPPPLENIARAFPDLNDAGHVKVAAYAADLAGNPSYKRQDAPTAPPAPPAAQADTDTTPGENAPGTPTEP